ncbi:hypothetical protein JSHR31_10700 [Helicobacter pylori]|uniref:hypothetical protein n=1 Tax=Helicobacter pylori TaxID=210 RepID=UPI00205EBEB0|nr:hypothetical protein [Helicobacter pylori]BCJ01649.1 hypothetical protein JSHR31_10700 [Helicobacter pylori]
MKIILFNQNPMITKLLESVSKRLELSMEDFNRYQELSTRLKEEPEWILIADDECLEKLDQVDWLELKETISQNKNSVCMYKKGNEAQPFLEGFEMKIKKPFLPTEVLKVLQKKLGSNMSDLEPSQNLDPTQEVLETNWDELENLGDLEALVQEEPNNEEQLLPTLNDQKEKEEVKEEEKEEVKEEEKEEVKEEEKEEVKEEEKEEVKEEEKEEVKEEEKEEVKEEEKEEVKEEEKEEVKETPQEEEKPKDNEIQEGETQKNEEVSKELETQEELEIPKEETQEIKEEKQEKTQEQAKEQEPIKEETQENKEEKQEKTQDSPSAQELEAMQELVKEIQENSNGQEDKKETQENTETPQEKEKQDVETPQEKETQEKTQESAETPQEKTQKLEAQKDHYESIEDIPEPVMAQAMGEELPFLNESVAKIPNNENDTETPKESAIKTPQEKEESDKTSSPLELRLNLQDLLKSLNQESLKSLLENKTLSIKITLEDKKPDA